jgi:hypothetical protein
MTDEDKHVVIMMNDLGQTMNLFWIITDKHTYGLALSALDKAIEKTRRENDEKHSAKFLEAYKDYLIAEWEATQEDSPVSGGESCLG